jgi:hypothetical protein
MLKRSLFLIGFISWLALVACSSGTVDPNANPLAGIGEENISSSSCSSEGISSSKQHEVYLPPDSPSSSNSSLPQPTGSEKGIVQVVVVSQDLPDKQLETFKITFTTVVTKEYVLSDNSGYAVHENGKIEVYEVEKGATASCKIDEKSYSAKFKFGLNQRVERSIKIEKFGNACEPLFEQFKNLCLLQNSNDELSGACDDEGTLEAYCAYVDQNANFDTYLSDFTSVSKSNCGDDNVHIDSFGI